MEFTGIDIGSLAISLVSLDEQGKIIYSDYLSHEGEIAGSLERLFYGRMDTGNIAVSSSGNLNIEGISFIDMQTALVMAAETFVRGKKSILHVGAEKFYLIHTDDEGRYLSSRTNSSCAAGTGSFLDQQARRLDIASIEDFCLLAANYQGNVPEIASRCAVFAKTDLIHAQQEGFSHEAICRGLCQGLARSLVDTLFIGRKSDSPILFTGGVSKNPVVKEYIEKQLGISLVTESGFHLLGAYGAAIHRLNQGQNMPSASKDSLIGHFKRSQGKGGYFYPRLELRHSDYPDFSETESYDFIPLVSKHSDRVQVEIFQPPEDHLKKGIFLGFDIGSTSTKAMISTEDNVPVLGFYTYTSGKPVQALKSVLEAFDDICNKKDLRPVILGTGTTGSGRKLGGKILNADLVVDEITSHARAAYHLDPDIDTIIEIGGQDAKFTILKQGVVTFSQMNAVCAAGTGSFIEEQARKLNTPLKDYWEKIRLAEAPLTSDRCTVFMERDLNYLLNKGYVVEELLAAVLFSVRENYLRKVASEGMIGKKVCFQGATAKNMALVAAFEQKLDRPIHVSRYCHLTGAFGVNLILQEEKHRNSRFRGTGIFKEDIPVKTEICDICNNHCKISLVSIADDVEAYGFLCGRDYETKKYVSSGSRGFDLLSEKKKIQRSISVRKKKPDKKISIGLPAALHMFDEIPFWENFFTLLDIECINSGGNKESIREGKHLAGAEFCAPVESLYGHVKELLDKADYIFFPVYIEGRDNRKISEDNYCYYTQFSPSMVSQITEGTHKDKLLTPYLNFHQDHKKIKKTLYDCLQAIAGDTLTEDSINKSWDLANRLFHEQQQEWRKLFPSNIAENPELSVVLLGRPYVVLNRELNKGIPDHFKNKDIQCYFQDMLPLTEDQDKTTRRLLTKVPWHFAASILEASSYVARTKNLYPVLITAFKCAPDAFITEYFKKIMDLYRKPYLILQIDEHDSGVGYETRIESSVRSFRNHQKANKISERIEPVEILPAVSTSIGNKTLLIPGWDMYSQRLLVAMLKKKGIDARLMESSDTSIRKSMGHNTGQCIPLNIIAEDYIEYLKINELDPAKTMLWMTETRLTCNIRLYPYYLKSFFEDYGHGFEHTEVYMGQISNLDISIDAGIKTYFAYMLGGLLRKLACRTRPYETVKNSTDRVISESLAILENVFEGKSDLESAAVEMVGMFNRIPTLNTGTRPEVAIFGDFFVRDHEVLNQDLIKFIEQAGGEVVTTPYHDLVKMTFPNVNRRLVKKGLYSLAILHRVMLALLDKMDQKYYRHFEQLIGMKEKINPESLEKHLEKFNVNRYHSGESYDNLLKIFHLLDYHPGLSLFIQTNPAFCCPALVTESMSRKITDITSVPIVTITYDGTGGSKNEVILPYLLAAAKAR